MKEAGRANNHPSYKSNANHRSRRSEAKYRSGHIAAGPTRRRDRPTRAWEWTPSTAKRSSMSAWIRTPQVQVVQQRIAICWSVLASHAVMAAPR